MSDYKKTIGRNIIWNSGGTLFYCVCQWLLTVLVVRLSGDYASAGILTLAMSIVTPLIVVATLSLRTFQVADMDERFSDGDFFFARAITSFVSIALCLTITLCNRYNFYTAVCIMLFMIYRLSEAIADVLHGVDQRVWRLDIVGKSFLIRGGAMLAAFVIGEYYFKSLLISITLMGLTVYGVILFYDIPSCRKCTQLDLRLNYGSFFSLVKIGVPLGAFAFLSTLLSSIPRLFMERWHGEDVLGVFGAVATITVLVPQMASFIFNPLIPVFAERWKANDIKGFNKLLGLSAAVIALIGGITLTGGYFFGEWGLSLVFGDSIRSYSYLLCPVIGTAILTACIWLLGTVLTIAGDYSALAWLSLISVAGSMAASVLLISESAYAGTILAMAVGLLLECIFLGTRLAVVILKRMDH